MAAFDISGVSFVVVEDQLKVAAGGRSESLHGVVAEVVAPQPATGRCKLSRIHAITANGQREV